MTQRKFLALTTLACLCLVAAWDAPADTPPLEATPRSIEFQTEDGHALSGMYYPAKVNPAPIVVLFHWAGGDKGDWAAIAPWLQNRADEVSPQTRGGEAPWLDASWFPEMPTDRSYGVFVFDFECFGASSCDIRDFAWLQDALAAMKVASSLEGANPNAIMTVGASIGADGALDGCYMFNLAVLQGEARGQCVGAFSMSPGNHLTHTFTYAQAVPELTGLRFVVYCLTSAADGPSHRMCTQPQVETYASYVYPGRAHGMNLIAPESAPSKPTTEANALELLLQFLAAATQ